MARTDTHRPSVINPDDYQFVGFQYLRVDDLGSAMFLTSEREAIRRHMESTGGDYSRHEHGGNCGVCGSVNAIYKALFWHKPSNDYVSTGLDCAEKLECSGVEAFRRNVASAREQNAGKRKAEAVLADEGLAGAWAIYSKQQAALDAHSAAHRLNNEQIHQIARGRLDPATAEMVMGLDYPELPREESTIVDIVHKLVKYGSLSSAQIAFLRRLVDQITNRPAIEAKRAAEQAAAAPVPVTDKRMTVRGIVLSIKVPNYDCGDCGPVRMLVQHKDGWKVWGSLPANLTGLQKGAAIEFDAKVKVSDRDEKFGFFSRPTKARQLESTL